MSKIKISGVPQGTHILEEIRSQWVGIEIPLRFLVAKPGEIYCIIAENQNDGYLVHKEDVKKAFEDAGRSEALEFWSCKERNIFLIDKDICTVID